MKIGDIEIKGYVVLGPMAGVTTLPYRDFMKPFGVSYSVSEMISDCGLIYGNKKTFEYLKTSKKDKPIALQLFGFDAENSAKAVQIMEKHADYDILDLNFGCPVPKVTKTGAGSSWLRDLGKLEAYVKRVVEVSSKPVTAKIRLGWDENSINVFDTVRILQKAGIKAIAVHCRSKAQGYSGKADYQAIADLKEEMSVPLIVSGDIFTALDAKKAIDITKADAVMVARGGMGHPFLITQINHYLETGELLPDPSPIKQAEYAEDFANRLIEAYGEETAVRQLKGILPHFFSGFPGYKKTRNNIAINAKTKEQMFAILRGIKERGYC